MALNVTLIFPRSQLTGLTPLRLELNEAISACFELVLDVESTDHGIDMRAVVGESIVVGLNDEPLLSEIEGFVRRVDQLTSEPAGQSQYRLFVAPPLWLTTRRRDHRIFKDLSVPEIVAAVLAGYAGRIAPPTVALGADHPKREYTVQYGETDHDFILRLLADEGIASYFDHGRRSAWTLVDDTTVFTPSVPGQIAFLPASLLTARGPFVSAVSVRSEIDTSEVSLRDYDFEKPEFLLQAKATATGRLFPNEAALESYEFEVGNFVLQSEADARAQQLLEEARIHHRVLLCETSFALGAGLRFALTGHPRSDVDGDLLVVRAQSVLDARTTSTTTRHMLECIEADRLFRPARRRKPRIFGTQTAFVVGAPGEEIDVDPFGRVEVEFRWDRRDRHARGASRRVRVSQGWAGAGFGFVLLPRVNEEVIVAYLDGDPDEPIIVGRVHNAFVATPLNLPAEKTQSVWRSRSSPGGNGFNEIRMEDATGAEVLSVHAQRDLREVIEHDRTVKVGNDDFTLVKNTHIVAVPRSVGTNLTSVSTSAQKIVLDTGAGATITMEGDKITFDAETIEVLAGNSINAQAQGGGIQCHAPGGGTSFSGPKFIVSGDLFAVGVNATATINAPDINLGGEEIAVLSSGMLDMAGNPVQINGPGPLAGRVTELAPATIATGVALVSIGGASFPLPVEVLPNGDLRVGKWLLIKGDKDFQGAALARLGVISTTSVGRDLFGNLEATGKTMTIVKFDRANSYAGPDDFAAATIKGLPVFDGEATPIFGPDGVQLVGTGKGSNVTVGLNPDFTVHNPQHNRSMSNDAVLFHEMTHGKHMMTGNYDGSYDPTFDTTEERETIVRDNPSEADYLKERNYDFHRTNHDSTFAPN